MPQSPVSSQFSRPRNVASTTSSGFDRYVLANLVLLVLALVFAGLAQAAPGNLAQGRPAVASSQETALLGPGNAVDGSASTRWASLEGVDPQWIYVDLGSVQSINHVVLNWETAFGKAYQIQVTTDATVTGSTVWSTVVTEPNGNGGIDDFIFTATNARFVRVFATQRGTPWGYSLFEFEVYAATAPPVLTTITVSPATATLPVGNTQTFTATGRDQFGAVIATTVNWTVSGGGTINSSGLFTATTLGGPFTVTATATTNSAIKGTALVTVANIVPAPPGNLALGKPALASSQETAQLGPDKAVDGNATSRWASLAGIDPQWIYVDIGAVYTINRVVLNWETAYGKAYQIQVSTDATITPSTVWTTVFNEPNGNGGIDDVTFTAPANARYVRVNGTQRGTVWGYSLYEFQVFGVSAPPVLTTIDVAPPTASVVNGNTQAFTATGRDQFGAVFATTVNWSVSTGGTINSSGLFSATAVGGPYTVTATATSNASIKGTATVSVTDGSTAPPGNLALSRPAVASSQESATYTPAKAVDGSAGTRWASLAGSDPQWIYVDLGAVYPINHVVLSWEAAYGKAYQIQVSTDAVITGSTVWTTVYNEPNGNGGIDDVTFTAPANARYVRVYGTQRGTVWGYSLYEFEVYGVTSGGTPALTTISVSPVSASVLVGDTQAFTATGRDQFGSVFPTTVNWSVSGGGTINTSGVFSATTATGSPFTVTAAATSNPSISGTAAVTVTNVQPPPAGDIAQGRPAASSSQESATFDASKAVDGNAGTRWASAAGSDPQWILVDLGAIYPINHVVLNWEAAYGKAYQIQVSNDSTVWTTKFTETNGNGGIDDITFATTSARYVRMFGTQRGTVWGYSLWDFKVFGAVTLPVSYNFTSTNVGDWSRVNDSGILSSWNVVSGAQYQQSVDVGDRDFGTPLTQSYRLGTYAYLPGLIGLSDYNFSVNITPIRDVASRDAFDGQDAGVMFRYQDNNNYYRVAFSARESTARLEKRVGGVFTALATISRGYVEGQPFSLSVNVSGNLIQVTRDGDPLFAVRDTSLTSGTVALYCQDAAKFGNVVVDVSNPNPTLVVSRPLAHSVQTGNAVTASAVVTNKPASGSVGFEFAGTACGTATESPVGSGFYTASCGTWARGDYYSGTGATGQPLRGLLRNSSNAVVASDENVRIGLQGNQLVSVGDSLTLGTFDFFGLDNTSKDGRVLGQQGFQAPLSDQLTATRGYPNMVFNEGVGGDRTTDTLTRISSILARYPGSNIMLLMLGANDSSTGTALTPAVYQANMQSLVNSMNGQGKTVWVAKSLPVLPFAANATRNADLQAYNTAIDSLTGIQQGPNFFKFFYDDNGTPGTTTDDYERLSMFYDKLHGNALAYRIMAVLWHNALTGRTSTTVPPATVPFYLDRLCNRLVSATCTAVSPTNHKQNLLPTSYPYYVDQPYTLTSIPTALANGIWIQTANAAAERTNASTTYINFTVDRPVKVYVAYDWNGGAATLPTWLSGWFDEGVNVLTTDPLAPTLHVYSKTFAAGPVSLGGNLASPASGADSNYLAVVVEQ